MKATPVRSLIVAMSAVAVVVARCRAEDGAPAARTAAVLRLAVGSTSQIAAIADDLGTSVPPMATAAGVENLLPFIGQGGLDQTLPLAFEFYVGGKLTQQQQALFYLPVTAGHAPIGDFLQNGKKLGRDGAVVNGMPYRRTPDYLLFGGTPDIIQAARPADLRGMMADRPLAYLEYDAKALRELDPAAVDAAKKMMMEPDGQKTAPGFQTTFQELATRAMTEKLNNVVVRLDQKETFLRLSTFVRPSPTFPAQSWPKPGMPDGLAARVDWQPPKNWAKTGVDWLRGMMGEKEFFEGSKVGPARREALVSLVVDAVQTVLGGDEASYGLGLEGDDKQVLYVVTQAREARQVHADYTRLVAEFNAAHDPADVKEAATLTRHAAADGTTVDRLTVTDETGDTYVVDSADRGTARYTTIGKTPNASVERLMAARPMGPFTVPAVAWVDVKQLLDLESATGTLSGVTDAEHELLNKVFAGERLNLTIATEPDQLDVTFDVPTMLVKNAIANASDLGVLVQKTTAGNQKAKNKAATKPAE